MRTFTPFLWFNTEAEEAAKFYTSIFKNSEIEKVSRYGEAGPMPAGTAMVVEFKLEGQHFMALNGGDTGQAPPQSPYPGAIALYVNCETQDEVDSIWERLLEGGRSMRCGWVQDKYGVVWNVVPEGLSDYIGGSDPQRAQRAMQAMLQMEKLDINELRKAYES